MNQITKQSRQDYLWACLKKFTTTEPKLSLKEIAEVIAWELPDLTAFLKEYKKELNKKI